MREQKEIVDRLNVRRADDFFGFEVNEYIGYLNFEHAKKFLKEGVVEKEWEPLLFDGLHQQMVDYMSFAWDKANGCRGLSAGRSLSHYCAWLWLDGNESLSKEIEDYEYYGKPQLVKICDYLGLDSSKWDDGARSNTEA